MTNETFWRTLEAYIHKDPEKIPSLILQANKEKLSVLVVTSNGQLQAIEVQEKLFAFCATGWNVKVPAGCQAGETKLDGFFFELIDSGYNGLAFASANGPMVCVEWSDLFPVKTKSGSKRKA